MPPKKPSLSVEIPNSRSDSLPSHSPTLDFVINDISIGMGGLMVNGKPTSHIRSLVELEDMGQILGTGSFGVVKKVRHKVSGEIYALKTMTLDVNEDFHEKKLLELRTLHQSNHNYIVKFHGAFYHEGSLSFVLEFMDCGTFADLVKALGSIPERPLGKLLFQLLEGLLYLHKTLHIIHRDIKPQNILLNAKGQAKITDFGVSGELANTQAMAKTFVGTVKYMSPNRISGKKHSAKSDIWSLGLVALECALGYYPYGADDNKLTFFQLLSDIVTKPPPAAPADRFSPEFCDFIRVCLQKNEDEIPDAQTLLQHPFILSHASDDFNLSEWIVQTLQKLGKVNS